MVSRRTHDRIVGVLEREIARLRQQNDQLTDRLMYLSGRTWALPPQESYEPPHEDPDEHLVYDEELTTP